MEGPRRKDLSLEPECRTVLCHTFKNPDASMWLHNHDIMLNTEMLRTDFMADLRIAGSVSI